jgi:hypothetical protein
MTRLLSGLLVCLVVVAPQIVAADAPRVLPNGQMPADHRLEPLVDLNGYFPFPPPSSQQEWQERSQAIKDRMQVAIGLWPMPSKTPLKAVVHGRLDEGDYTVEKVYFESLPGFFVTGKERSEN